MVNKTGNMSLSLSDNRNFSFVFITLPSHHSAAHPEIVSASDTQPSTGLVPAFFICQHTSISLTLAMEHTLKHYLHIIHLSKPPGNSHATELFALSEALFTLIFHHLIFTGFLV